MLDQLEKLAKAATPGPWRFWPEEEGDVGGEHLVQSAEAQEMKVEPYHDRCPPVWYKSAPVFYRFMHRLMWVHWHGGTWGETRGKGI